MRVQEDMFALCRKSGFLPNPICGAIRRQRQAPAAGASARRRRNRNPVFPRAGTLAARVKICLLLLPSGPDKIHSMTPHETQPFPYGTKGIITHFVIFCNRCAKFPVRRAKKHNKAALRRRRLVATEKERVTHGRIASDPGRKFLPAGL